MKNTSLSKTVVLASQIPRGTAVVIYARCSGGEKQTLNNQSNALLAFCHEMELQVIDVVEERASGRSNSIQKREKFIEALKIAKQYEAILVSDNLFRFIRNAEIPKSDLNLDAERILSDFVSEYGVVLSCRRSIYLSEKEIHSERTKEGIQFSDESIQRNRDKKIPSVVTRMKMAELHRSGMSYQNIAKQYGIGKSTVFRYCKELRGIEQIAIARSRLIIFLTSALRKSFQARVVLTDTLKDHSSKKQNNHKRKIATPPKRTLITLLE